MLLIGFLSFLILYLFVGALAIRNSKNSGADYLLSDRSVSPILTALSAAATKYSGYMFIGLMGYIFLYGLSGVWLIVGFLFGDLLSFFVVPQQIRKQTNKTNALSYSHLVSAWYGVERTVLRKVIAALTLLFLTTYAAAQLNAGGKALQSLFSWPLSWGVVASAILIMAYVGKGGLRASIWTDAVQSLVMVLAMSVLLIAAIRSSGGWSPFWEKLDAVSPTYLDWGSERFGSVMGLCLFAFGWLFNGLGVAGQPQVMVRFMAMDQAENTRKTGIYYFAWSSLFLIVTFMVGLATRIFVMAEAGFDAELALPSLTQSLLPDFWAGLVLAGIFAASISTADSQVLSCSAALSEDFNIAKGKHWVRPISTITILACALALALYSHSSVFTLTIIAWSILSAAIGPLVIIQSLGFTVSQKRALIMMFGGIVSTVVWRYLGFHLSVYEGAAGMLAGFGIYLIFRLIDASVSRKRDDF